MLRNLFCVLFVMAAVGFAKAELVSYWNFDETSGYVLHDSVSGNDAVINGPTSWVPGKVGNAFNFNGSGNYAFIPSSSSLDFTGSWTVAAWLKPTDINPNDAMMYFSYNNIAPYNAMHFRVYAWGTIRYALYGELKLDAYHIVPMGEWTHATVTYDNTTGLSTMYLNGDLVAQTAIGKYTAGPAAGYIGRWTYSGDGPQYWKGLIDEMQVYDNALSADEVRALVPEPCTVSLLGFGILMLARRK